MKKVIVTLLVFLPILLLATVIPAGDVNGTWELAGSPYYIDGEITIPSGEQLVIEAGVDVIFNEYYKFFVNGRIVANGTVNDSINFSPLILSNGWHSLRFYDGNDSSLENSELSFCQFKKGFALGEDDEKNGGAIFCSNTSNINISNCKFSQNYSELDGGAIYLENNSDVEIIDCYFNLNNSGFFGGSICSYASDPILRGCTFKNNESSVFAAGVSFWDNSNLEIYNCYFINNIAQACAGLYGVNSTLKMANVFFENNNSTYGSGGACALTNCISEVSNITAINNEAPIAGGAFWVNGGDLEIYNSILWNNLPESIFVLDGSATAGYSCISDGFAGLGVISDNPEFMSLADGDFHLSGDSPCVDTGDVESVTFDLPEFDLDGNVRLFDGNQDGTTEIDMGCYEYFYTVVTTGFITGIITDSDGNLVENAVITASSYSSLSDAEGFYEMEVEADDYAVSCYLDGYVVPDNIEVTVNAAETVSVDFVLAIELDADDLLNPTELRLLGNYPNPFNPTTTIAFTLAHASDVKCTIYNCKGQLIKTIENDNLSSGIHKINWNGKSNSGITAATGLYYYTIKTANDKTSGKMLMLK